MPITQNGAELTVEISEKAAEKIKYFAHKEGLTDNVGLRVAVKGGGCSGLTYDLAITDQERESDKIVEQYGVKVMVDKKSYIYLVGTQLDFSDGLNGKGSCLRIPTPRKPAAAARHSPSESARLTTIPAAQGRVQTRPCD